MAYILNDPFGTCSLPKGNTGYNINSRSYSFMLQGEWFRRVRKGRGALTIIPLTELLRYLGVVWPSHDADLHFPPQGLEKPIQLWVNFLQIKSKCPQRDSARVPWSHYYIERVENASGGRISLCVGVAGNRLWIDFNACRDKTSELHTEEIMLCNTKTLLCSARLQ